MIHKNRGNRRKENAAKALRKARIIKNHNNYWCYKSLHQLSKGKIHCSCAMCSAKTNNSYTKSRGPVDEKRHFCRLACTNDRYGKKSWKTSDRKKIDSMNNQKEEYYMG